MPPCTLETFYQKGWRKPLLYPVEYSSGKQSVGCQSSWKGVAYQTDGRTVSVSPKRKRKAFRGAGSKSGVTGYGRVESEARPPLQKSSLGKSTGTLNEVVQRDMLIVRGASAHRAVSAVLYARPIVWVFIPGSLQDRPA